MKQAKDRKKQLARVGHASNLDFSPLSLDKMDPEFVSEVEITKMHSREKKVTQLKERFLICGAIFSSMDTD